jgi:hypothetical protein
MVEFWGETLGEIDTAVERLDLRGRDAYFECHYERFCADPRTVISEILLFLGQRGDLVDLGEAISNMNHKFEDSASTQLLERMEVTLADMRPPHADVYHTNTWADRLDNYRS